MYGKIYGCTYERSMAGAGACVFAVMGYVIAKTVKSRVELNPTLLSVMIGEPVEKIQAAINYLCSPDPKSTNKEYDGRRLVREGEYLYFVPSHETYRSISNTEELMESNRQRQAKFREKQKKESGDQTPETPISNYHKDSLTALNHLNKHSGRNFRKTDSNMAVISARLSEPGVTIDGVTAMIQRQCSLWRGSKMEEYLRPETLFGKQKFDSYYAAKDLNINNGTKTVDHNQSQESFDIPTI